MHIRIQLFYLPTFFRKKQTGFSPAASPDIKPYRHTGTVLPLYVHVPGTMKFPPNRKRLCRFLLRKKLPASNTGTGPQTNGVYSHWA